MKTSLHIPSSPAALLLLSMPLASTSLAAQEASNNDISLPVVNVEGVAPSGSGSLTVPSVAQQRQQLYSTVGSVAFIDQTSFQDRYTNNITDILKDTPGVFAQTRYGQEIRLSVRGSGMARGFHTRGIEILQDGLPFNMADGSGDFYEIDPLSVRSAEVYKGGNALAFGASTLGGAINFVTPTAYTAIAPNVLRIEGGSFGAIRGNAQISRVIGDADFLVNLTKSNQDGFRQHERQDYTQFNGNFGYRIAPGIETRFYAGIYETRQKLPGTLDLVTALSNPRAAAASVLSGDQARNVKDQRIANRTSFALPVGKLDIDSWFMHKYLYHPIFQVVEQDGLTYGVSPHWTGTFDIAGHRDDLIIGGRFFGGKNLALQYININGGRSTATTNALQRAYNYEGFLDNKFWLTPQCAFMTGAKLYRDERNFTNRFTSPYAQASTAYSGINPKAGLLYQPLANVQLYADITKSADVPDFSDLAQTNLNGLTFVNLQQQQAWTAEIGTRGTYERYHWDVAYYRSSVRNELINFNTNAALGVPAATFNAPQTLHQGVELAASVDLVNDLTGAGDSLTLAQIYTYNDFRFVNNNVYGNNRIAGAPPHVLRTTLTYRRPEGFYISPTFDWVPVGAFADHANTLRAPGYTLFGIQTGWNFSNGLSITIDARNLGNTRYISDIGVVTDARTLSTAIFYPGEGRAIFAGMRYAF